MPGVRAIVTAADAPGMIGIGIADHPLFARDVIRYDGEPLAAVAAVTLAQAQAADPVVYARRLTEKWQVAPEGGESYVDVQARMTDWYGSVTSDTVAVAHGGTARALMVALGFETAASAADLTIEQGAVYVFGPAGLQKHS